MRETAKIRYPARLNIRAGGRGRRQLLEQDLAQRRLWRRIAVQLEKEGLIRRKPER